MTEVIERNATPETVQRDTQPQTQAQPRPARQTRRSKAAKGIPDHRRRTQPQNERRLHAAVARARHASGAPDKADSMKNGTQSRLEHRK